MNLAALAATWIVLSLLLSVKIGGLLKRSADSQIAKPTATMVREEQRDHPKQGTSA